MHEYKRRILLAADAVAQLKGFSDVEVQHDDSCPFLVDGLRCRCDPFITVTHESGRRYRITEIGRLEEIVAS